MVHVACCCCAIEPTHHHLPSHTPLGRICTGGICGPNYALLLSPLQRLSMAPPICTPAVPLGSGWHHVAYCSLLHPVERTARQLLDSCGYLADRSSRGGRDSHAQGQHRQTLEFRDLSWDGVVPGFWL